MQNAKVQRGGTGQGMLRTAHGSPPSSLAPRQKVAERMGQAGSAAAAPPTSCLPGLLALLHARARFALTHPQPASDPSFLQP